jgi:hypothetical protein
VKSEEGRKVKSEEWEEEEEEKSGMKEKIT